MNAAATPQPGEQHNDPTAVHDALPSGGRVSAAIAHDTLLQLYGNSASGLIASVAFASVLVATHWSLIAHPVLLAWWSGITLLTAAQALLASRFKTARIGTSPATWFTRHLAGVVLSGIGWGAAGILLFTPNSVEHQAFLSVILAGMAAGAASIFAVSRRTFLAFALPACLPIITQFLLMGDQIHQAIGVAGLIFLGIMTGLVWSLNRELRRTFTLRAERNQAETALLDLFESTNDLIQSVAPDGRLLFVNRAWRETLGYSAIEVESLNIFDVLHPDGHEHCRHFMRRILAGEHLGLVEMAFRTKDGRAVIAEGHVSLHAEDGRPVSTRGIFRDITRLQAAEAKLRAVNQNLEHLVTERTGKLRESEQQYRQLVAAVPSAVYEFRIDAAGRRSLPFISKSITDLIGLSPDECMADAEVLFRQIQPDALLAVEESIRRSLESLSPWTHEFPARTTTGETKWVRGHSMPQREDNGATRWHGVLVDITERKQAEEALRASEERFRASYHNASVGMSICDLAGRLQEVNEILCQILGYSKQELLTKDFQSLTHPDDLSGNLDRIRRLLAGTVTHQVFEKRYVRKDGEIVWAQVGLSVIRNHDRTPSHLLAVVQDITERKQAENRLRATQYAVDHATDYIFVIDHNGHFLDVNESACHRLGYTKQELLTKSVMDIDPDVSPAVWETFWNRFKQQKRLRLETKHRSKSGKIFPVEVVANYILRDGQELDYAFVRDITERKQAEEALRASEERFNLAVQGSQTGIWDWDLRTNQAYFSPLWKQQLGYEDHELPDHFEEWQSRLHPGDRDRALATVQAYLDGQTAQYELEHRLRHKDGSYRWILARGVSIRDAQGKPYRMAGSHIDITDRKQAEKALQFLSTEIAHLSGDAFFGEMAVQITQLLTVEIGFVGKLLATQTPRIRALGLAIDGQILPPIEYDLADTPCERVIGKHTAIFPDQVQQLFPHDQLLGDLGIASYAAVPLFDTNGRAIGHVGVMSRRPLHDIKQVEDMLRLFAVRAAAEVERQRTEAKFHDLFEFSPDAVIMANKDGLIALANRQAESLFGYSRTELIDLPVERLMPESNRQEHTGLREQFMAAAKPRAMGTGRSELHAIKKDGTVFPIDISLSPIQAEEGLLVMAAIRDITEPKQVEQALRESEERFRILFEQAGEGVAQIETATGRFVRVNQKYCAITGYSEAEMLARNSQQLTFPEDLRADLDNMARLTAGEIREFRLEKRYIRKDGTIVWVKLTVSPMWQPGAVPDYHIAMVHDITERKQAEAALQASQDQIRQMKKMEALGQLAGGIAHDFNNILTAILGNAEIAVLKSEAEHPSRPNLARILEAGQRASHVVQQILTFTRQQDVSRTVLSLSPVVTEALTLLRATLPAGIELTSTADAATPHVLANATQLHQVLMNLCTNAWHALRDQPGRISIDLASVTLVQPLRSQQATLPPGRYARLSVRDTGCGMPPETVARIFDPFFTTKPLGQGTGLGLSVVHGIVQGHDGAIVVESAPGEGTTFHLYFPAVEAPPPAHEPSKTPQVASPQRTYRLLYLDDEAMLVELVRALFEPLGYRITGCTKPAEALALVRADPDGFDMVVTDYNMPELSGLEVARELARIRGTLPVVLVSGYLTPEDQAAALAAHVKEIIYKPTMLQELGTVLTRLLDSPPAG